MHEHLSVSPMASVISHAAAAAAASIAFAPRGAPFRFWAVVIATALLPDADSFLFHLGIPYGYLLGHRGFFHSPFFGLIHVDDKVMVHATVRLEPVAGE